MKVRNALKKVKSHFKKQGIDIVINHPEQHGSYKWSFEHDGYVGSFSVNGMHGTDPDALDGDATLFHVRRENDHSDLYTDYHAGSFRDNITQVCESLLASPPKYPVGTLVRGRQNKRAKRFSFNGKVGLVMSTSDGYCEVQWVGETPKVNAYYYQVHRYSFRDLEVAS